MPSYSSDVITEVKQIGSLTAVKIGEGAYPL